MAKEKKMISLVAGSVAADHFDQAQQLIRRATGSDRDLSGPQMITVLAEVAMPQLEQMSESAEGRARLTSIVLASVNSSRASRSDGEG